MLMSLPVSELKNYSLLTLTLPANYGYCIFVAVGSALVIEWKIMRAEEAREKSNLEDPLLNYKDGEEYRTILSAHQKMLDRYPQFLGLLLLGGLDSPVVSAAGGTILVLGEVASAFGCGNTDTKKRICCAFVCAGWLAMFYSTTKLALKLLQVI